MSEYGHVECGSSYLYFHEIKIKQGKNAQFGVFFNFYIDFKEK